MKSILTYILLSVFLLQTFSKVFIYADYLINKEYISKVLCVNRDKPQKKCNGKCHLKAKLVQEEKKEQSPVSPEKEKNEIQLFSETNFDVNFVNPFVLKQPTIFYQASISDKHTLSVFHPPSA